MRSKTWLSGLLGVALVFPGGAEARDFTVSSFDKTRIAAHFFQTEAKRAPTVLLGPGWGNPGAIDPNQPSDPANGVTGVGPLRRAGYNVVTWDPRGFGASGGEAKVDSPHYEARDVQKLIDAIATMPEAELDAPGDPRVGMAGASYGGGIQWVTAAIDSRVDAITPDIAWHSLESALAREGLFKTGWGSFLCGVGAANGVSAGLINPAGLQGGSMDRHFYSMCETGLAGGTVTGEDRQWFADRGPGTKWMAQVAAPALLIHSTVDTLFSPSEAIANFRELSRRGTPARMMWFCGGHGACQTSPGPSGYVEAAVLRWFARYLKRDEGVQTGPGFEWIDQFGNWRSAGAYPLEPDGQLTATGAGTLPLVTADPKTSGTTINGTPATNGVNVNIIPPAHGSDLAAEPVLELEYSGSGTGPSTHVFAQLVDLGRGIVLGGQVTPLPVTLDGQRHTVKRTLEGVAYRVTESTQLQLQVIPASNVYGYQRVTGSLNLSRISLNVPLGKARPVTTVKPCRPAFKPRTTKVGSDGKVKFRPRLSCDGRRLRLPLVITGGLRPWTGRTGKLVTLRVRSRVRRLTARYTYGAVARSARITLER